MTILWEPQTLAAELGVALPEPGASPIVNGHNSTGKNLPVATAEPVNLDNYPTVLAALDNDTGDRSVDTMRIVGACFDAGLTYAQVCGVVHQRPDLADRLADRKDDDLQRCWHRIVDSRQTTKFANLTSDTANGSNSAASQDKPAETPEGMPRLWRATDLKPAGQQRWLAKGRLVKSAINLLIGDEGIGKSLLWVWITAATTTGKPLPEFGIPAREPAHVVVVVTEDDWTTTVRPRLELAGANLDRISVICTEDDGSGAPVFPRDLYLIIGADPAPALVVVDAWLDTVPSRLSVRDPQHARQALHPWKELATVTDAAVLLLCHTNRVSSTNARDRYGSTAELRKKARMTLYAQSDDDGRLVVGPEKMNTAAPLPASTFTIEGVQYFDPTPDDDGTVPRLVYAGDSDRTAREHIADSVEGGDEPGGNPAKGFVHDYLMGQGGEATAEDVIKAGRAAGFNEQEIKDGRRRHRKPRIVSRKASMGGGWVWAIDLDEGGNRPEGGTDTPEGGEGGSQDGMPPALPPSPPSLPPSRPPSSPICGVCHKPMAAGQTGTHLGCRPAANSSKQPQPGSATPDDGDDCCIKCRNKMESPDSIARGICEGCWVRENTRPAGLFS
jgi:AAA domain